MKKISTFCIKMPRFLQFWGTTIQKSSKINNFPSRARNLLIIQTMQNFTKIIHSICPTTLDKIITLKCVNFVNFVNFWKEKSHRFRDGIILFLLSRIYSSFKGPQRALLEWGEEE